MINIIVISLIVLNLFAIFMLYKMLNGTDKKFRIVTTIILIIVNFVLVNIIYSISKIGVEEIVARGARNFLIFTMLPINLITMASPLAIQISKARNDNIEKDKFIKNIIVLIIIDVIIICVECGYIKNIQLGIERMKK